MKISEWTQKISPFLCPALVCLYAVFALGLSGCGDDEGANDWVGTWKLDTVDGESFEQSMLELEAYAEEHDGLEISAIAHTWTFDDNGTFEMEFAFSYEIEEGGVQLEDINSLKMMGTYSLSGSNYTLTREKTTVSGWIFTVAFGLDGDAEEDEVDTDTGTWSRKGDTLTLTSEDGTIRVYKRK